MPEFPVPADEVFQVLVGRRGVGGRVQFLLRVAGEAPLEEVAECAEALLHALDGADEEEEVEDALHEEMTENRLLPPLPFNLVALVKTAVNNGVDSV
mgnify:CR=1 FL=1